MTDPTLHEALQAHGHIARKPTEEERAATGWGAQGKRAIVDRDGNVVGLMTADEAWQWLRDEHGHTGEDCPTCEAAEPVQRRWVWCRVALGREPRPSEYIRWANQQWEAFFRETGHSARGPRQQQYGDAFDAWLEHRFGIEETRS